MDKIRQHGTRGDDQRGDSGAQGEGRVTQLDQTSVSLEQLWRLREERLERYWARYLREMSDMSVLDKSKCRKEERGDLLLSLGLNKEEMEESYMLVTKTRFKQVIAGQ